MLDETSRRFASVYAMFSLFAQVSLWGPKFAAASLLGASGLPARALETHMHDGEHELAASDAAAMEDVAASPAPATSLYVPGTAGARKLPQQLQPARLDLSATGVGTVGSGGGPHTDVGSASHLASYASIEGGADSVEALHGHGSTTPDSTASGFAEFISSLSKRASLSFLQPDALLQAMAEEKAAAVEAACLSSSRTDEGTSSRIVEEEEFQLSTPQEENIGKETNTITTENLLSSLNERRKKDQSLKPAPPPSRNDGAASRSSPAQPSTYLRQYQHVSTPDKPAPARRVESELQRRARVRAMGSLDLRLRKQQFQQSGVVSTSATWGARSTPLTVKPPGPLRGAVQIYREVEIKDVNEDELEFHFSLLRKFNVDMEEAKFRTMRTATRQASVKEAREAVYAKAAIEKEQAMQDFVAGTVAADRCYGGCRGKLSKVAKGGLATLLIGMAVYFRFQLHRGGAETSGRLNHALGSGLESLKDDVLANVMEPTSSLGARLSGFVTSMTAGGYVNMTDWDTPRNWDPSLMSPMPSPPPPFPPHRIARPPPPSPAPPGFDFPPPRPSPPPPIWCEPGEGNCIAPPPSPSPPPPAT